MDNIFSLNNIYLRCYFLLTFFATTYAAPGVSGSFAGSSSAAFSSASASAHAGSVASAISSANAFTGGAFPSKNPDNTYGLTHQQGISAGSGSYIGLGNINPDSNKFGLSHQVSGTKGSYNNKSQTPCSGCPNNKEKWELDNYDDQSEEKEEEWQEGEQDDCDDGQYRLEHHYHHHKSGVNKKQEEQTMSSIHKIENTNQYNYNQGNNKDGYTTSGTKEQGNLNDRTYNNYGNLGYVGANNQNLNNNYDAYQHNTGALKDSLHPSSSWIDINKKKENENKNLGIPGVLTSTSTIDNKYGNTNKDTVGGITSSQPNLGWTSDTYAGCSNTGSGSGTKCAESTGASNSNQAPVKISQSDLKKTTNHSMSEGNRATTACNNLHGNCGNSIIGEKTQYQSTSVDSTNYMQNGYTDSARKENKPNSYDQQNTGQWKDHANKDNSPSGVVGNVGVGSGCTPGVSSAACSREPSTLQKNTPIPTQIYGTVGSGPGNVHVGNKPHSYDQQNIGQWKDHANKDNSPSGVVGNVGVGSGCTPGVSSPACLSEPSTLQKNTPIPTQIYGTVGNGPGNVHVGNKPHSYDQQNTGQWKDHADKDNSPSGVVGDVGVGSGCTAGVSSPACSSKPSTLQKNTPIPTQGCTPGMSLSSCSSEIPTVQKNVPTFSQTFGTTGSGASYQNNKNTNQPSGSGNCGTFGSSTCIGSTGYPIGSSQTTVGAIGNGHNIHGQSDSGDKNSYKWNGTNPFLHGGQGNLKPVIHTTSSPIFITNSLDAFDTTSKPIGFGNPFLDGTISNTFGTHHDKHDVEVTPIKSDALDKPIGVGNPFLTNGNGGSKSSTPIYSGANIGSVSSINILPIVTTTIKPIGQNNPFLEVSGGNVVNKYPLGVHPNVAENNKNVLSGSGTSADKDSIHFPKSGVGITSPGTYSNTNRGVKSNNQHNKIFGNVATSNAGSSSTGNIDIDKSTGLNIPSAYNSNNSGHGVSSLTGTAGNNKPSYTLSTSPEFYDYKNISPQTSGNGGATNGNRNSPSNSLINGNNANGQFNPQITNAGAQSFAGAHAGSFASSFSSSQTSSSSSSFASSKSGSYTANGDPNILHQLNGNWPFDIARSVSGASSWPSLNAGSHASAFASSSVGGWSGSEPSSVKS